jgi:VWFA-related protein
VFDIGLFESTIQPSGGAFRMSIALNRLLILCLFASLTPSILAQPREERVARNVEGTFASLIIENSSGSTAVSTWKGSTVRVEAWRSQSRSGAALDSEVLSETSTPGLLKVVVKPSSPDQSINLSLEVPEGLRITVRGKNSPLVIRGPVAGSLSAETETGNITLYLPQGANADLSLRTIEGSIATKLPVTIFGTLDPQMLDGRLGSGGCPIILRSLRGRVSLLDDATYAASTAANRQSNSDGGSNGRNVIRTNLNSPDPELSLASRMKRIYSSVDSAGEHLANTIAGNYTRKDDVLRLEARLVNLNVKVTDTGGKAIPNLKKEDFQVFENDVLQDVSHFEPVTSPISLVLLLDLSGSTRDKIKVMRRAAKKFVESLRKDDRVAIAAFTTKFYIVSSFTSDHKLLKKRIDDMGNKGGDTALYDAAWSTFEMLSEEKETRKALVVLTDGVDSSMEDGERESGSKRSFDELLVRVIEEDATIYPIYLDTEYEIVVRGGTYTHEIFAAARKQLELLAEQTGGTWFKAARIEDLEGVYERVASELHTLYSVGYHTKDTRKEGRWRRINVKITRAGSAVRSKRGYFAK